MMKSEKNSLISENKRIAEAATEKSLLLQQFKRKYYKKHIFNQ